MGKFANEPVGAELVYIGDKPLPHREDWHGHSEFEAMGHKVPSFRKTAAQEHMKDMGFTRPGDAELRHRIVEAMSDAIERDNSHAALEKCLELGVDATGCYRLLSVLLCAPLPVTQSECAQ